LRKLILYIYLAYTLKYVDNIVKRVIWGLNGKIGIINHICKVLYDYNKQRPKSSRDLVDQHI